MAQPLTEYRIEPNASDDELAATVAALDDNTRARLLEILRDHERATNERTMLELIYATLRRTAPLDSVVGVLFHATGWDNGCFLSQDGTVLYIDGTVDNVDFGDDIDHVLTQLYGRVWPRFTVSVDLRDNTIEASADSEEEVIHRRFDVPEPPRPPDIGDQFTQDQCRYTVTAWIKRNPKPSPDSPATGPDKCPLVFCTQQEAEYLLGAARSWLIVRIADVEVDGHAKWAPEIQRHRRRMASRVIGQEVT